MSEQTAIVWFRRDLRIHDHPSLHTACAEFERVIGVFVIDRRLIGGRYASGPRTAFMLGCLRELDASLTALGSGLVIRDGDAADELTTLAAECGACAVLWASDVGPYALARDGRVSAALREEGIEPRPLPGNHCADVSVPRTGAGKPYSVFTPFWRNWRGLERRRVHRAPEAITPLPPGLVKGRIPSPEELGVIDDVADPVTGSGETAGRAALQSWLAAPIDSYESRHDDLCGGTSVLSPHLRWGTVSAREAEARAVRHGGDGAEAFVRQLAWRDFFAHVLLHNPRNTRLEQQPRYRALEWADDPEGLAAWQTGQTGFPLVDAAMRQLSHSGWMHNRARMVVGSFLTKDLHLDWRLGEQWFAAKLLDGEPLQNNGNWQWIASTGADPAPYFRRLFNPTTQGRKFDPDGTYIRRWVPELRPVPDLWIHDPASMSIDEQHDCGCVIGTDYPAPIVDHRRERERALDRYRETAPED